MILPQLTRKQIHAGKGKPVEIVWPADAGEPVKGGKYTVQTSADRAGDWRIEVVDVRQLPDLTFRATVRPDADPVRLLGKAGGYATSGQGAIATRKPVEPATLNGPQFRSEVEPEAVPADYQRMLSDEAHFTNLRAQGRQRDITAKLAAEEEVARKRFGGDEVGARAAEKRAERAERRLAAA